MSTWGLRRTASALAVAAAVAGVGGAAIAAATGGSHHTFSGGMHGGFGGPGGPPSPPAAHRTSDDLDSIHGNYVVADGHGGFTTLLTQTGRITAISADSVTARSDDGFTATYVIRGSNGAAKAPIKVDERVVIRASREGQAALVTTMAPALSAGR
jgi:hypothetical protein